MDRIVKVLEFILHIILVIAIGISLWACVGDGVRGEAYKGEFGASSFNLCWQCTKGDTHYEVRLPDTVKVAAGEKIILENKLPRMISDGMRMCVRASVEDVYIYIDGILRGGYASKNFKNMGRCLPSAYLLVDLEAEDAGKPIRIEYTAKVKGEARLKEITIGYGNNSWFMIIQRNASTVIFSLILFVLGLAACLGYLIFHKKLNISKAMSYLGFTLIVEGLWALSESEIRQLFFRSPSYTNMFTYMLIGTIGAFACLYFDEVQEHKYRKYYVAVEIGTIVQFLINAVLNFIGIKEYYETLIFSHLWIGAAIILALVTILKDVYYKKTRSYYITSVGMLIFVISCIVELASFYFVKFYVVGAYVSIGLIILLGATFVQTINDEINKAKTYRVHLEKMNIRTLKTVAKAIDAKDEYTGGHSERVATYAEALAARIAVQYGFNKMDISRIHYIGLLHDIGKIGVPDSILNKPGRLTDEEFEKMKLHTVIGEEMLSSIDNVPDLLEGIRHHHEKYDGTGYPDHLKGEDIPLIARILCIADCYDAMTSDRVYRKHLDEETVIAEFKRCAGTQFDPGLVKVFLQIIEEQ